jgi:hypothetical protein
VLGVARLITSSAMATPQDQAAGATVGFALDARSRARRNRRAGLADASAATCGARRSTASSSWQLGPEGIASTPRPARLAHRFLLAALEDGVLLVGERDSFRHRSSWPVAGRRPRAATRDHSDAACEQAFASASTRQHRRATRIGKSLCRSSWRLSLEPRPAVLVGQPTRQRPSRATPCSPTWCRAQPPALSCCHTRRATSSFSSPGSFVRSECEQRPLVLVLEGVQ